MAYPAVTKLQVQNLRSKGKTYTEILKIINLKIPKSTLSKWCESVSLPKWYKNKLKELNELNIGKAQQYAFVQLHKKRREYLEQTHREAGNIFRKFNMSGLKMMLAMLYLGEGSKISGRSGLCLGSSDPNIITLYILLLERCYGILIDKLRCRISYRADQNIKELEKYWSRITGIPLKNFYKTKFDPRTVGKPTKNLNYKGVCVITCAGARIQLELETFPKLLLQKLQGL